MATLALSVAGQFAGGLVGGPFGATLGRALGALAGSAVDAALFEGQEQAPLPSPALLQGSREGDAVARIYGWNRLTGNVIWATQLERQTLESAGAKGISDSGEDQFVANFAVGLCEGEVARLGRIWADGRLLETQDLTLRFYSGAPDQEPDPLMIAKQGAGNVPAYRGLCYLVFEGLPLGQFGNRIPNISVELCRIAGDLEPAIRAVTLIPGATEFGYDPVPRVALVSPGVTRGENTGLLGQTSDWTLSLDELQALCPNLEHVALVVSWFGSDLRCGQCTIRPKVENPDKALTDASWSVSGLTREQADVMTQYQGGPAYGGTPSDSAVLAAIADLKARGLKVTLYPFVLMDIAHSNTLVDPYTGLSGQPAYPWRGRITCDPAPGQTGSPDGSALVDAQVNGFVGSAAAADFSAVGDTVIYSGPHDWGYRRMILHYARLVQMAGGVDAMLIGSELRGLTWLRNGATGFPFVEALASLADDVRDMLGTSVKLSYGADWSEYSGFQPPDAPGDKLFHLDGLWASPSIDAVGIDNYMPLSDWRGTDDEPDAQEAASVHELDYLSANIAAGEGFDWFYASEADRQNALRTPITDAQHNEPWVWRFKDIRNWWENTHHNRVGGIRESSPTPWVPRSKPIWFTELGCAAIDKGSNTPNVFGDEKSAENARPHFSSGEPDALIQRQFLRAHHGYWQPGSARFETQNNPDSPLYQGPMVDPGRLYVWTWDARPYPAFPFRADIWSDGKNHLRGHWLTGRLGSAGPAELLERIAADYGFSFRRLDCGTWLVPGVRIDAVSSLRAVLEPVLEALDLHVRDTPEGVVVLDVRKGQNAGISPPALMQRSGAALVRRSPGAEEMAGQVSLSYLDRAADYQPATAIASNRNGSAQIAASTPLVLDPVSSGQVARTILARKQPADSVSFDLPLSRLALETGDLVAIEGEKEGPFVIEDIRLGKALEVSARALRRVGKVRWSGDIKAPAIQYPVIAAHPESVVLHLPEKESGPPRSRLVLGAYADPWPQQLTFSNERWPQELFHARQSAILGTLLAGFPPAPTHLWDRGNVIELKVHAGHLSAVSEAEALDGANRIAIQKDDGNWEIVGFADALLVGEKTYRLRNLLRGQVNTLMGALGPASAGNRVMLIDGAVGETPVASHLLDSDVQIAVSSGNAGSPGQTITLSLDGQIVRPLPPVHLRAFRIAGTQDIRLDWKRRSLLEGDLWGGVEIPLDFQPLEFLVSIFDGSELVRQSTLSQSFLVYEADQQLADFGTLLPGFDFQVQQVSAVFGPGHAASSSFLA